MDLKNFEHKTLYINGVNLHYYRLGSGKTKLLMLPPYPMSGIYYFWLLQQSDLEDFEIVTMDIPGWIGMTEKMNEKLTADVIYAFVCRVIETLKWRQFNVLGYSFGGALATRLVAEYNEAKKIVLVSPVIAGKKMGLNPLTGLLRFIKRFNLRKEFVDGFNLKLKSQLMMHKSDLHITKELWDINNKLIQNLDKDAAIDSACNLFEIDWSNYLEKLKHKEVMIINSVDEFYFFRRQADIVRDTLANEKSIFLHGLHEDFYLKPDSEVLDQILLFLSTY